MTLSHKALPTSLLTAMVVMAHAVPARACAVCFQAKEGSRMAYYGTTAALLLLPLLLIGGFVFWIRRRLMAIDALERAESSEPEVSAV